MLTQLPSFSEFLFYFILAEFQNMQMGDSEHEIDGIIQYETWHPEWDVLYDWSNVYYDKSTLPDHKCYQQLLTLFSSP
jgi:hypothetical protein